MTRSEVTRFEFVTEGHEHILCSPVVECVVKTEDGGKRTREGPRRGGETTTEESRKWDEGRVERSWGMYSVVSIMDWTSDRQ